MTPFFFSHNGKIGLQNDEGVILIEAKYDKVRDFKNGLAAVCRVIPDKKDSSFSFEKWYFIDKNGVEMKREFESVEDFEVNAALVKLYGCTDYELIDKKGNLYFSEFLPYDGLRLYNVWYDNIGFGLYYVNYERRNGVRSSSTHEVRYILDTNEGDAMSEWKEYSINCYPLNSQKDGIALLKKLRDFRAKIEQYVERSGN